MGVGACLYANVYIISHTQYNRLRSAMSNVYIQFSKFPARTTTGTKKQTLLDQRRTGRISLTHDLDFDLDLRL